MKRVLVIIPVLLMLLATGCSTNKQGAVSENTVKVVAVCFPEYDWLRELTRDTENIELMLLISEGIDAHSYQPSAKDMIELTNADLLVYSGGESLEWVSELLLSNANNNKCISLLDVCSERILEEEHKEGMEEEPESEEGAFEFDEHVWLSLKNAKLICEALKDALMELDAAEKDIIDRNGASYVTKLSMLDAEYMEDLGKCSHNTLVFGDRYPFRYLLEDYGLDYYAAFPGCSAESEASFETVLFLADKLNELGLDNIIRIDGSDERLCQVIIESSKKSSISILELNSMQSIGLSEAASASYLDIMRDNLEVLKKALN